MEEQKPVTESSVSIPTEEEVKHFGHWMKYRRDNQALQMALHQSSMIEFCRFSVDEKRQALIEWKLQYEGLELALNVPGEIKPKWWFYKTDSQEQRAEKVRDYEVYVDSLRGASGFERAEVKALVQERRRALLEAIQCPTKQTLHELLDKPGFERFKPDAKTDTQAQNLRQFELYGASQVYPAALLYSLFNDPPEWLQRTAVERAVPVTTETSLTTMKARERQFILWLEDAAQHEPDGWLTLEMVSHRNAMLSVKQKVFRLRDKTVVDSENVRGLLNGIRKYAGFEDAIETKAGTGKAWRLARFTSK